MSNLKFDREKSNLGGIAEIKFIYEKDLFQKIDVFKGKAIKLISYTNFIVPDIVFEKSSFKEEKESQNLFIYEFIASVAKDDYNKLLDCLSLDNNKIIVIVKDNNNTSRILGNKSNACLAKLTFDKGMSVSDLNSYQLNITWKTTHRAAFIDGESVMSVYQFQDGELFEFEDGELFSFND